MGASIYQQRMDYGPRALQLTISNESDAPITVTRAAYSSPRFTGSTEWTRPALVAAEARVNLRILLGTPACDGAIEGTIHLDYELEDGSTGTATLVPGDEFDTLASVTAQDCLADRTAAIVDLELADHITTEVHGDRLVGLITLTATPTGATGTASVASVGRTILLRPEADGGTGWDLGWSMDAASGVLTATLPFEPSNCNPHIVAEDKRGTFFPLQLSLDDGTSGTVFVGVTDDVRRSIYEYIGNYCHW